MSESAITQSVPIIQDTQKEDHTCTYCGYDSFVWIKDVYEFSGHMYDNSIWLRPTYLDKHEESKESLSDA